MSALLNKRFLTLLLVLLCNGLTLCMESHSTVRDTPQPRKESQGIPINKIPITFNGIHYSDISEVPWPQREEKEEGFSSVNSIQFTYDELDLNGTDMMQEYGERIMDDSLANGLKGNVHHSITWLCEKLKEKRYTQLKKLNLSKNFIGDEGAQQLAELLEKDLLKLEELDLSFNRIGKKGLSALAPLLNSTTLKYLVIYGNNEAASQEGISELVKILGEQIKNNPSRIQECVAKVIWLHRNWVESAISRGFLHFTQGEAHKEYYFTLH